MRLSDDELRAALRAEATAHRPDRDAMLDRITMGAMDPAGTSRSHAPRSGTRARMAAAATAVLALLAGGGLANWALAGNADDAIPTPVPTTVAPSPQVTGSPSRPAPTTASAEPNRTPPETAKPSATTPSKRSPTPSRTPAPALTKGQPGFTRVEQGPLWSDGSIEEDSGDTGGASVVTLKTTERLTALDLVIRVARTDGLVSRGGTKQTPGASVTTSVTEQPGALLYRFTLASADTLAPGTYTFTARYTHPPGGRDAGGDTYEAVAGPLDVYGNFYPG